MEDFLLTIMGWIVGVMVVALLIGVFILLPIYAYQDSKIDSEYKSGQITLQQFCDEQTDNGTSQELPVACYAVYNFKADGETCSMVGKTIQCHPKLESK